MLDNLGWSRGDRFEVINPRDPHFGKRGTIEGLIMELKTDPDTGVCFERAVVDLRLDGHGRTVVIVNLVMSLSRVFKKIE